MRPEKPGIGKTIVGVAAAALATGPTVVALSWLAGMLLDQWPLGPMNDGGVLPFMVIASLFGLIGSLPAACVNAVVLSLAARNDEDAAWLSAISGAVIAMLVAVLMAAGERAVGVVFVLTGMLMGLLHWVIAIRPRRRWRLSLLRDEEAIRAME